jgi:hypothetical protein
MLATFASGTKRSGAGPLGIQAQWDLKLAQRLAVVRKFKVRRAPRRDVNALSDTNYKIPEGFRGG